MSIAGTPPAAQPRRWRSRVLLLVLMVIPAVPSIFLLIVWIYGKAAGCDPAGPECIAGIRPLGDMAKRSLDAAAAFASFFVFLGGLWFALALVFLHRSFAGAGARLLAALLTAGWSVLGPIVAGLFALSLLAPHCAFNEGGVGTCRIFGVATTGGHHIGTALWGVMIGVPLAGLIFLGYAAIVTIIANKTKQKTLTFPPRNPS